MDDGGTFYRASLLLVAPLYVLSIHQLYLDWRFQNKQILTRLWHRILLLIHGLYTIAVVAIQNFPVHEAFGIAMFVGRLCLWSSVSLLFIYIFVSLSMSQIQSLSSRADSALVQRRIKGFLAYLLVLMLVADLGGLVWSLRNNRKEGLYVGYGAGVVAPVVSVIAMVRARCKMRAQLASWDKNRLLVYTRTSVMIICVAFCGALLNLLGIIEQAARADVALIEYSREAHLEVALGLVVQYLCVGIVFQTPTKHRARLAELRRGPGVAVAAAAAAFAADASKEGTAEAMELSEEDDDRDTFGPVDVELSGLGASSALTRHNSHSRSGGSRRSRLSLGVSPKTRPKPIRPKLLPPHALQGDINLQAALSEWDLDLELERNIGFGKTTAARDGAARLVFSLRDPPTINLNPTKNIDS